MKKTVFGRLSDGREVHQYTLTNRLGSVAQIIDYGATVTSLIVPDRNGVMQDVVLGCDSLQGYVDGTAYFGAIVGRYGNRIANGRFQLDGIWYQVSVNDGANHLHGGRIGFNKVLWNVEIPVGSSDPSIRLRYVSRDGEEGYPGTVVLQVTYTLTAKNELRIDYEGTSDKPTVLNPTHHSYFNLSGSFTNPIVAHELQIESDLFTPVDAGLIPTGELAPVENTPMDFRSLTPIGLRIDDPYKQLRFGQGYDHNWVLRDYSGKIRKAAELYEPSSGRVMTVLTDQPGLQFYSGNFLDGKAKGKNGIAYALRTGLCLETQAFPDTPNRPDFPTTTLRPGRTYRQTTIHQFSTR
ncbi:MAG: galactose mutarotase [Acidobacteria bacterium]|nr:galactose mutarotase [Acidobacteriota bacterium]